MIEPGTPIEVGDLIAAVADVSGFDHADLIRPDRTQPLASWRQVAMYLVREHTDLSYPAIGRVFNRDHSTVVYAVSMVRSEVLAAGPVLDQCEAVYAILEGGRRGVDKN